MLSRGGQGATHDYLGSKAHAAWLHCAELDAFRALRTSFYKWSKTPTIMGSVPDRRPRCRARGCAVVERGRVGHYISQGCGSNIDWCCVLPMVLACR
eukprot:6469726-Amphidinium_carterae.1